MAAPRSFSIHFLGDVMLGRLIDQMFPTHVDEPDEARLVQRLRSTSNYGPESPWGNTLTVLRSADLRIANLETSVTTHAEKWQDKVFNYRMHPVNVSALKAARIDYVSLANNHTLDFGEEGLVETVKTVREAGIASAGAGLTTLEAHQPAILSLGPPGPTGLPAPTIAIFSASDHPRDWSSVPLFHLIDYAPSTRERLKHLITTECAKLDPPPALKVFSVHWGPNYAWNPSRNIRELAHFLIDSCGIDIVHGHSSHHVQGLDRHGGKLIIYGCGDFVDDYAVVPGGWRNDLSAVWRVTVVETAAGDVSYNETSELAAREAMSHYESGSSELERRTRLKLRRLEVFPTRIESFEARLLDPGEADHRWVRDTIVGLSRENGMKELTGTGKEGQLIIEL